MTPRGRRTIPTRPTGSRAAGEGRLDGLYSGVIGLLIGAGLYSERT